MRLHEQLIQKEILVNDFWHEYFYYQKSYKDKFPYIENLFITSTLSEWTTTYDAHMVRFRIKPKIDRKYAK